MLILFIMYLPAIFTMVVMRKSSSPISIKEDRYKASTASVNSLAITLAMVLEGLKMLAGKKWELPITMVTAMVSPRALPRERRMPANIPERA